MDVKLTLTEQEAVDLLNAVDHTLRLELPDEDTYNGSMRAVVQQLEAQDIRESHLAPGGLEFVG